MKLSSVCSIKPAVVTPYFDEDKSTLDRFIKSVADQSYAAAHFLIADGKPQLDLAEFDLEHLILPAPHRDYGNTPRCIGALSAINRGFDAIFFLDADNWYEPSHVEEAIRIKLDKVETDVVASLRKIILPDNIEVSPDADEIARSHVDTSCMALFEGLKRSAWQIAWQSSLGDPAEPRSSDTHPQAPNGWRRYIHVRA